MWNDNYDIFANDSDRWVSKAKEHLIIAKTLLPFCSHSVQLMNPNFYTNQELLISKERLKAYSTAIGFSLGMALENIIKAKLISEKKIIAEDGKLIMPKDCQSHDLDKMLKFGDYNINLTEYDILVVKYLSFCIYSLGKFPIAKNIANQNNFTGTQYNHLECSRLTKKIFNQLFQNLVSDDYFY
jgi:hypothetical protein